MQSGQQGIVIMTTQGLMRRSKVVAHVGASVEEGPEEGDDLEGLPEHSR